MRYLLAGAAILALAGWGWIGHQRAEKLTEDLGTARAELAEYARIAEVQRASLARLRAITEDAAALDRDLQQGEGADAPLDDYLRSGAGRVWGD